MKKNYYLLKEMKYLNYNMFYLLTKEGYNIFIIIRYIFEFFTLSFPEKYLIVLKIRTHTLLHFRFTNIFVKLRNLNYFNNQTTIIII